MNKQALTFIWLLLVIIAPSLEAATAQPIDPTALFPELEGWSRDGALEQFQPDNLYEHINGAAENFLAYGFERLVVQNYVNKERQALTAEVYFHGTPENAFGIYGSEKPLAGDYLAIGGEGYAEEGVLNFISDAYYVKLNGFDLGIAGADVLRSLAEKIARAINGSNALPPALAAFPVAGRVSRSERYFLSNFLGLDFLGPAFAAGYERAGKRFRLFLMTPADPAAMLKRWTALDKDFAGAIAPGRLVINDPYNGPLRLFWQGKHVIGAVDAGEAADDLLQEMAKKLDQ